MRPQPLICVGDVEASRRWYQRLLGSMVRALLLTGLLLCLQSGCTTHPPPASELQSLQGTWEGHGNDGKITVRVTGDSFHFFRDTNFWFETSIVLPAGKHPKQLHATIKHSAPPEESNGKVVKAFFKIEGGTLTLATMDDDAEETLKSFEAAKTRFVLRKVPPLKQPAESTKIR